MPLPRTRLASLLEGVRFPLDKVDLISLVEEADDIELLDLVTSLDDDHYVDRDELDHRMGDALGMPDSLADDSAIAPDSGWRPTDAR